MKDPFPPAEDERFWKGAYFGLVLGMILGSILIVVIS